MGKGGQILEIIRAVISRRIVDEAQTADSGEINKNRNINPERYDIPSDFNVELYEDNLTLKYKSVRTISKYFDTSEQIGIQMPVLFGKTLTLRPGMKVQLSGVQSGAFSTYETEIKGIDEAENFIFVRYSEEARVLLSQKNFSIAPSLPVPVSFINPALGSVGSLMNGKILEISRVRLVVLSEDIIPDGECLSMYFTLPDGQDISSPLVIARKRREQFMYNIECIVIDEKERAKMIQYMYKRQIEMAKK